MNSNLYEDELRKGLKQALTMAELGFSVQDIETHIEKTLPTLTKMGATFMQYSVARESSFFDFESKIKLSSHLIGCDITAFVKAALKNPSLFYQSPETLNGNVEQSATLFGIEKPVFVKAALKNPSLFCQSPETLLRNFRLIKKASDQGYIKTEGDILDDALKKPTSFCYAPANSYLRMIEARISNKQMKLSTFFAGRGRSKKAVEERIFGQYQAEFNESAEGAKFSVRALHSLAEAGITSRIPEWAQHAL